MNDLAGNQLEKEIQRIRSFVFLAITQKKMLSFQVLVTTFLVSATHSVIDHTQYVTSPNIRERDMATHRGNRFVVEYNDTHPRFYFATQAFAGGLRTDANFAADFEDPKAGTYGWTVDSSRVARNTIRGAHRYD